MLLNRINHSLAMSVNLVVAIANKQSTLLNQRVVLRHRRVEGILKSTRNIEMKKIKLRNLNLKPNLKISTLMDQEEKAEASALKREMRMYLTKEEEAVALIEMTSAKDIKKTRSIPAIVVTVKKRKKKRARKLRVLIMITRNMKITVRRTHTRRGDTTPVKQVKKIAKIGNSMIVKSSVTKNLTGNAMKKEERVNLKRMKLKASPWLNSKSSKKN